MNTCERTIDEFRFSLSYLIREKSSMLQCAEIWQWCTGNEIAWNDDIVSWTSRATILWLKPRRMEVPREEFKRMVADVIRTRDNFPLDLMILTGFFNAISRHAYEQDPQSSTWEVATVRFSPGGYVVDVFRVDTEGGVEK